MDKYTHFSNGILCNEHNIFFKNKCPKCKVSKDFTSKSQVTTSKRQGVTRNILNQSVFQRFHNYGIKFVAEIDWVALFQFPEIHLNNNVSYKRIDSAECIVKVFKKSIVILLRSNKDIKGLDVKLAEVKAMSIVESCLKSLPSSIKVTSQMASVSSVHNAFVNHPTAKHNVNVRVNDELRLISDNSHGKPEFEAISPQFAINDSQVLESWNKDLITRAFDLPSITKTKLDFILQVQLDYAENIKKHLAVQDKTLEVLDKISSSISSSRTPLATDSSSVVALNPQVLPPTILNKQQRLKRTRELLNEYGWGGFNGNSY